MKHTQVLGIVEKILEFQHIQELCKQNGNFPILLGGSIALALQGYEIDRDYRDSDLDITVEDYFIIPPRLKRNPKLRVMGSPGNNIIPGSLGDTKIDFFKSETPLCNLRYKPERRNLVDTGIPLVKPEVIWRAKLQYAQGDSKSCNKHREDILEELKRRV